MSDESELWVVASYREIAERFGLGSTDAARMKAKRSGWGEEPRNHPRDDARIRVPRDIWDAAEPIPGLATEGSGPGRRRRPHRRGAVVMPPREPDPRIAELEGEIAGIRHALEQAIARAQTADGQVNQAEARARNAEDLKAVLEARLLELEARLAEAQTPGLVRLARRLRAAWEALLGR